MAQPTGTLYIVATPIGNLDDISQRALQVLAKVDRIAAEDTRHSQRLLGHYGIRTPLGSLHEHNERQKVEGLLAELEQGLSIALISDAGTPLISDPGFPLVRAARERGIRVVPVPGCSAAICALSAAGLPTDRFVFEGFLPARGGQRENRLRELAGESRTLVFYESSHRILDSLASMAEVFGEARRAVVARELTKTYETIRDGTLAELLEWMRADAQQQKGEFVVLVEGAPARASDALDAATERVLATLLEELSVKQSATLAAKLTGVAKKRLYERALELQGK
ncbi:MAG: 16S rRNA (cytidine(1402)-2'-O)-methyltransferase [Xanthomonadaceae bacterium]|nr:16S rRNA (cytidine(1402)-2'-O)-methyltransferase [Xanthomonadaceae bacterium]